MHDAERRLMRVSAPPYCVERQFRDVKQRVQRVIPDLAWVACGHCRQADKDHRRDPRSFAHVGHRDRVICVAEVMGLLPEMHIRGILWHEFGHLARALGHTSGLTYEEADVDVLVLELWGVEIEYDDNNIQVDRTQ